ncbi:AimR family lysis-lysogeny pheromone receptor [Bacillus sp. FSL W7-1360]
MWSKGTTQHDLAYQMGMSEQALSRLMQGRSLDFKNTFIAAKYFYKDSWAEKMDEYCLGMTTTAGVISAFEYAYSNDRDKLTKKLLEKHSKSEQEIRDCHAIYKSFFGYTSSKENGEDRKEIYSKSLEELRLLYGHVSDPVLNTRIFLFLGLLHFDNKALGVIPTYRGMFSQKINALRDTYVRDSLFAQYHTLEASYCLYADGDVELARLHAGEVIKNYTSSFLRKGAAMHIKSLSYLYKDKQKSISCMKESAEQYRRGGYRNYADEREKENTFFIRNVHKEEFYDEDLQGEELAHQLIVRGKNKEALEVIDCAVGGDEACIQLYKSMAKRDVRGIMKAYKFFLKQGYTYFLELCENELEALVHHNLKEELT